MLIHSGGVSFGRDDVRGNKVCANDPITCRITSFYTRIKGFATPAEQSTRVDRCSRVDIHVNLGAKYVLMVIDFGAGWNIESDRISRSLG